MKRRLVFALTALALTLPAMAQQDRNLRVIVPYPAGGNADNIARLYAEALGKKLGRPVVVENRPGAGAVIGAQAAARAPADGNTLFVAPTGVFVVTPHLTKMGLDPLEAFLPVAKLTSWIPVMVVRKDFPANNFNELVAELKKNPGKYSFASAGPATMTHLMGELMNLKLGVKTVHVPYKGSAEFIPDLISGRVDFVYDSVVIPQVKAGQLRPMVSMVNIHHPELKSVPTLKEVGVDLDTPNWYGVFVPKGTPSDVVDKLGEASREVMQSMDTDKLTKMSMAASYQGPAEFKAQLAKDDALMKDVIQKAEVKMQ
ncbi:Bug family tripartite tricarboxylate transporter substrate binding protein [Ottowia thiooxydans]|uniref:Tripartite-type tricarboxylate transporter receptor subunit TctC n=1 Tax=Ottowia thiooxydans TaxID=219182 RepID=A0ABV2Q8U0_9BURK